jgi:hypothetical protein
MRELRIHIERIVRPIGASPRRKLRMREELLAHLTAIVEEEGSLERALTRFGDPQEIRRELQAAVPWRERLAHTPLISDRWRVFAGWAHPRAGERPVRHALRITTTCALLCFLPCALVVFVVIPLEVELVAGPGDFAGALEGFVMFGLPMFFFLTLAGFACVLFGQAVVRRRRGSAGAPSFSGVVGRGLLLALTLFGLGFLFTWVEAVLGQRFSWGQSQILIGAIAGVAPLVGTWVALKAHEEGRAFREWKSLRIDD